MLILGKDTMKDPSLGYARTFVRQVEDCLGLALEQGVKIVSNAGGLNPAGLADRLREVADGPRPRPGDRARRGRRPRARLGLLRRRADRQRLPRRLRHRRRPDRAAPTSWSPAGSPTPALVVGPAVAHHGWTPTSYDELAGAVVAGHVIECGTQATGGNFSGFRALLRGPRPAAGLPDRRDRRRRLQRDHQARRHRRRGHRRHRHRAAGLRDPVDPLPRPRRHHPPRHRSSSSRPARTGSRSPASAARHRRSGSRSASTSSAASATRWSSCSPASTSRRRPTGCASSSTAALTAADVTWSQGRAAATGRRHRGGAPPRCSACTVMDPQPDPVGRAFTAAGGRARARVVPRLHDDRPAAAADAVRRLPAGVRRPRHVHAHRRARRRPPRGSRRPARRSRPPTRRAADRRLAVPGAGRLAQPPDAAGHVRARALRRQGRRRQPRALGRQRRRPRARRPGHLAGQADQPAQGPRAGPRGRRPRGRGLRAAQPRRRQRRRPRPARPGRRRVAPGSTRRPRGSASGALAASCTSRRTCCDRRSAAARATRSRAREFVRREVAPHLQEWEDAGEIPRALHLAAGEAGAARRRLPRGGRRRGRHLLDSSPCRRRCSRPARPAG